MGEIILHYLVFQIKYLLLIVFVVVLMDSKTSAVKTLLTSLLVTLPVFLLDIYVNLSPLGEAVIFLIICTVIMKHIYKSSYSLISIAAGLGFIIFSVVYYIILPLLDNFFIINPGNFIENSCNYSLIFLPEIIIMLIIIYLIKHIGRKYFEKWITVFNTESCLFYDNQAAHQEHQQIQRTLFSVIFFLILLVLFIITVFWAREVYPFLYRDVWYSSPIVLNLIMIFIAISLVFLIKHLIELMVIERNKLLKRVHNENMRKMNWELKMQYHDFNHHLGMLNMMLKMGYIDKAQDYLNGIVGEVQDIHEMVKSGNKVLNTTLYKKRNYARERMVSMSVKVISPLRDTAVEDWDLSRIAGNLIKNAVEALEKHSGEKEVEVIIEGREDKNIITVKTLGVIIEKNVRKKLFEKGFSSKEEGRGLGLAICKKIVDFNAGKISVDINSEEGYTAFIVELPIIDNNKNE